MQYSMWIFNDDWYLHIGVNGKVTSFISYCKVILCQFGFWCVKGHLVTSQPAFVTVKRYKHSIISTCTSSHFKYLYYLKHMSPSKTKENKLCLPQDSSCIDGWSSKHKINVTTKIQVIHFVARFDFSTLCSVSINQSNEISILQKIP